MMAEDDKHLNFRTSIYVEDTSDHCITRSGFKAAEIESYFSVHPLKSCAIPQKNILKGQYEYGQKDCKTCRSLIHHYDDFWNDGCIFCSTHFKNTTF